MVVAFDTDALSLLLNPSAKPPNDPVTQKPIEKPKERMELLVEDLQKKRARIAIPAPVLAEFLVLADEAGPDYLKIIDNNSSFDCAPFDALAAIEAAASQRRAFAEGDKKSGAIGSWQKVKVDRQIVAIAKVLGADCLYTGDADVLNIARRDGVPTTALWDLPAPEAEVGVLPFGVEP